MGARLVPVSTNIEATPTLTNLCSWIVLPTGQKKVAYNMEAEPVAQKGALTISTEAIRDGKGPVPIHLRRYM